jgi:Lrp/AsnC family leucine-responsive transcriptional regulator
MEGSEVIDAKDHEILKTLSQNCSISTRDLARRVALSQSATVERMRSLEKKQIVPGYTYVVDFSRLGLQAFSIIISAKTHTAHLTKRMLDFATSRSAIIYMVEAVGAFDYKFGALLERPSDIIALSQEVSEEFGTEISWLTTLTAFDYRKVSRYPFDVLWG